MQTDVMQLCGWLVGSVGVGSALFMRRKVDVVCVLTMSRAAAAHAAAAPAGAGRSGA